ncbi:hypothetical protein DFH09DRAFT_1374201 [Mycena vulgaris]|nr:hypothetical protein DFH09DRAFT_1374201 [Mycena vulgaris]
MKREDWMVSVFEIEYGSEIGAGGFGTVFKGTCNRTEVAIKLIHNPAGVCASVELLRKEIDFLGANTMDDLPFFVMLPISHNARKFVQLRPSYELSSILHDISLGL